MNRRRILPSKLEQPISPFCPRGYVYRNETSLYYLQSRYYDPELGRFINADAFISTGQGLLGNNMFAYCGNNPINCLDPSGYLPHSQFANTYFDGNYTLPYIIDQEGNGVGNKRFGITTVSHGGCGPIATYNALISLGRTITFDDVLAYYNSHIFELGLGGLTGTPTDLVVQYFRDSGYGVRISNDPDEMDILSMSADACILWYMFPATYCSVELYGAHFVSYKKSGTSFIGYNTVENNGMSAFLYASDYGYSKSRYYSIGIYIYK